jgi:16S rRNA (guanine966-N2)-methyltransferase
LVLVAQTLRVIAGEFKGRRLAGPVWDGLRPTADRLRETMFNILARDIAGARVLDGFAGTGAIGIEALSRGAATVTFVEQDSRALRLIGDNLARVGVQPDRYTVVRADLVSGRLAFDGPFDIVILDPPYAVAPELAVAAAADLVAEDGCLVLEHARRTELPAVAGRLVRMRVVPSGDSALTIFHHGMREAVNP